MAGRGTDIQLGGNKNFLKNNEQETPEILKKLDIEKEKVKSLGGLCIVGTERHESRRIDNQLRGRSGRQGDPGSSIFYISLEDDLTEFLEVNQLMVCLKNWFEETNYQSSMDKQSNGKSTTKGQARNFEIRKTLLKLTMS